jgi:CheY-like chemotaxis protein
MGNTTWAACRADLMIEAGDKQFRVLVAEDDVVFRRVITFTLQRAGFAVTAVANGALAWECLGRESFDCLVTDHQMPQMSGIELLNLLRKSEPHRGLPTVLCTAKGLELDAVYLAERYQLAAVMHKPFSPRKLVEILSTRCCAGAGVEAERV